MRARRRQRVVERRGDDHLDDRLAAPAVPARIVIGAIHVAEARRQDDAGGVMVRRRAARQRREARQLRQRDVHAERAGAAAPAPHAVEKIRIERAVRHHRRVEELGIDVGGHRGGRGCCVRPRAPRRSAALLDQDLAHRHVGLDLDAVRRGGARHRLRDRAHAADRMAPDPFLAVHLAEGVVQQHVGGAGRIGAGIVADDGVEAVQRLDQLAFEPAVEIVGGRLGEQVVERPQIFRGQPAQPVAQAGGFQQFADRVEPQSARQVRRRLQDQLAQHVGGGVELAVEGAVAFGVDAAELCDLAFGDAPRRRADIGLPGWAGSSARGARRSAGRGRRGEDRR